MFRSGVYFSRHLRIAPSNRLRCMTATPRGNMDASDHSLEILLNLIYLARHSAAGPAAVDRFLAAAEKQALQLVAHHRRMRLAIEAASESWSDQD